MNLLDSGDWPKETLDIFVVGGDRHVESADELREAIAYIGDTVEHFKTLAAYKLPLASGRYPWLADL